MKFVLVELLPYVIIVVLNAFMIFRFGKYNHASTIPLKLGNESLTERPGMIFFLDMGTSLIKPMSLCTKHEREHIWASLI